VRTPCPECGAIGLTPDESGSWRCPHCGLVTEGAQLPCPACGAPVEVQADRCPACGEATTWFGQVMSRHDGKGRLPVWLAQARARASDVRQDEDLASRKRLEILQDIDRRRLESVEQEARAQALNDRRTLLLGLGLGAALVIVFLALALAAWSR